MAKYYYHGVERATFQRAARIFGGIFIIWGVLFLLYFFFPVVAYQLFLTPAFASQPIETPIPQYMVADTSNSGMMSLISQGVRSLTTNYDDARNWYPQVQPHQTEGASQSIDPSVASAQVPTKVDQYYLSIPKLGIEDAIVSTTDYDLDKHLVHYYGPDNPIFNGTSVIYGHSTIPQWFDPHNYKAIFATLHTIKVGDEIDLNVLGSNYTYKIFSITITSPTDVNIFTQTYDNSYVTLVTCTPPGTTWKRLIVRAALER